MSNGYKNVVHNLVPCSPGFLSGRFWVTPEDEKEGGRDRIQVRRLGSLQQESVDLNWRYLTNLTGPKLENEWKMRHQEIIASRIPRDPGGGRWAGRVGCEVGV